MLFCLAFYSLNGMSMGGRLSQFYLSRIVINTRGVACAIDRLLTRSSPGPDRISTKLLKIA